MAVTPSNMMALKTLAPDFSLPDTISGEIKSLQDFPASKATVIMFICNHCPYVKHLNKGIVSLAVDFQPKGVNFVAVSSNDVINYPDDSPEKMKENGIEQGFTFPYLYDESQAIAKAYEAACTPDFYVFDKDLKLAYRGQFDDSRPGGKTAVTGNDIRNAITALLKDKPVSDNQTPSIGCNIKWKA